MSRCRTDLRIVRDALALADEIGVFAASQRLHMTHRTLYRWRDERAAQGRDWPTNDDIAAWDAAEDARAAVRARWVDYKKRRYRMGGRTMIDAIGTIRRLHALMALGHTGVSIGAEVGLTASRISQLSRGHHCANGVLQVTAERVRRVYDDLSMTRPDGWQAERMRRMARRNGWAPPLAWTDIDDPDDVPKGIRREPVRGVDPVVVERLLAGETVPSTRAEKDEAMRRWKAWGRSEKSLCEIHGWKDGRYGRGDAA